MKLTITLGAFGVIAMTAWLFAASLHQSGGISFPTTLTAVKDFVGRARTRHASGVRRWACCSTCAFRYAGRPAA
jgi:hypothetical protein